MIRRPPRSTLFPSRRSSDLARNEVVDGVKINRAGGANSIYIWAGLAMVLARIGLGPLRASTIDRKSTRLNSSHSQISYAVFCLKKKTTTIHQLNTVHSNVLP